MIHIHKKNKTSQTHMVTNKNNHKQRAAVTKCFRVITSSSSFYFKLTKTTSKRQKLIKKMCSITETPKQAQIMQNSHCICIVHVIHKGN